ncbi:hypothetical protein ACIHCQ_36370 [Streptomyces sp. NPDC052236]
MSGATSARMAVTRRKSIPLSGTVARIYARLSFRPAGTTLLIANQPARGQ